MDGYADRSRAKAAAKAIDSSRPSVATVAVWGLAGLVHLTTVATLVLGAWLTLIAPSLVLRVPGLVIVLFGLFLVPWPRSVRKLGAHTRVDLPELFALLDRVAEHNGGPVPHLVGFDPDYNASTFALGRRRVLVLGAPLWVAAPPHARLALLGHELGHFAHRDVLSSSWTAPAHRALEQWRLVLRELGDDPFDGGTGLRIVTVVIRVLVLPFRALLAGYVYLLDLLAASSSRSREYLADLDAISTGGSDGALALLDTLLAGSAVEAAVGRAAIRRDDAWHEVRTTLARDDLTTRLRRRAHAVQEESRIDDSHPSHAQRIRLVEEREQVGPGVVVDTATWHRLDAELEPYLDSAGSVLVDAVRYQH